MARRRGIRSSERHSRSGTAIAGPAGNVWEVTLLPVSQLLIGDLDRLTYCVADAIAGKAWVIDVEPTEMTT